MQGGFKTYCMALKFPTPPYTSIDAIQGTQERNKLSIPCNKTVLLYLLLFTLAVIGQFNGPFSTERAAKYKGLF